MNERIVHWKRARFDFYLGRAHRMWGIPDEKAIPAFANPYKIGADGNREEVVQKYETYIRTRLKKEPDLKAELLKMKGKVLACWCAPMLCHISVVVKLINEFFPEPCADD